jgi:hypothetical protein
MGTLLHWSSTNTGRITIFPVHSPTVYIYGHLQVPSSQLWKMDLVRDRKHHTMTACLALRHAPIPKVPVDFTGRSYFGDKNDQFVFCDQDSGSPPLLPHLGSQYLSYVHRLEPRGGGPVHVCYGIS